MSVVKLYMGAMGAPVLKFMNGVVKRKKETERKQDNRQETSVLI